MGDSLIGAAQGDSAPAIIERFYSDSAWIEGAAEEQLTQVARLPGAARVAAFPDLHPGKYGPVGCAVLSERLHPRLIGADIGCGMALFRLDQPARKLKLDKAAARLSALEGPWDGDAAVLLAEAGLPGYLVHGLGTIGGGNHFCEVQAIDKLDDPEATAAAGVERDAAYLLVHSGSRGYGYAAFTETAQAESLDPDSAEAAAYRAAHDQAVAWARLNRRAIALRAAAALRAEATLLVDSPHNLLTRTPEGWLHRKGAAQAEGGLAPLAGSRDAFSYLLAAATKPEALGSLAHGSGRRYDRASMHGRVKLTKSEKARQLRPNLGGRVVCADKDLLIEEVPQAYKNPAHVVRDLEAAGLARRVATFRPLITFKKAAKEGRS